jgi:hypothetical protein
VSDDLARLTVVSSELEAEMVRGLLEDAGIAAIYRPTDLAAGALDGWAAAGTREVLVAAGDLERARELIAEK